MRANCGSVVRGMPGAVVMLLVAAVNMYPAAADDRQIVGHTWVCDAYGHGGGSRSVWRTVRGERSSSLSAAQASALDECRNRSLSACRSSGCWQG